MYIGEVLQGEKGWLATVSNGVNAFTIYPLGEAKHKEFYDRSAAQQLAEGHAIHANNGCPMTSSSWRRMA